METASENVFLHSKVHLTELQRQLLDMKWKQDRMHNKISNIEHLNFISVQNKQTNK